MFNELTMLTLEFSSPHYYHWGLFFIILDFFLNISVVSNSLGALTNELISVPTVKTGCLSRPRVDVTLLCSSSAVVLRREEVA